MDAQQRPSLAQRMKGNTFLKHVLTLMTGTAVAQIIPLAARPVLSRTYTTEEFGLYSLYLALGSGIAAVGALRYDLAVVTPKEDSEARSVLHLATRIALVTAGLTTLVLTLFSHTVARWLGDPSLAGYLPLVGLLVFAMTQLSSRLYWLNRRQRYKEMARNKMGQSVGTTGVQLLWGLFAGGPLGLVAGSLVGQWFSMLNLNRLTRSEVKRRPDDPSLRAVAHEHRKMPLVQGPNALVDQIRLQGINLLIAVFFARATLGQFAQAWTLLQMPMGLINGALTQVFYQKLSTTRRGLMFPTVRNAVVRAVAVGVVPFLLIWLLSPWLFPFVLGSEGNHDWSLAGQIARVLVPWLFMNFITSPISLMFITVKRQEVMFVFACLYAAVPLSLIWFFHSSILDTMQLVSLAMAALLVVFVLLALMVSWQYDRGHGLRDDERIDADEQLAMAQERVAEAEGDEPGALNH